jgi:hypothetical protein
VLLATAGLRRGKILGLWRDVNLDEGYLEVRERLVAIGSRTGAAKVWRS